MNKYANTKQDIHERIFCFILRVFQLIKKVPKTVENIAIIEQISKSLTSIGANDQEADGAQSKKDFIAKYGIVKKEAKETDYGMRIIIELQLLKGEELEQLKQESSECKEILKIISSIIINAKSHDI